MLNKLSAVHFMAIAEKECNKVASVAESWCESNITEAIDLGSSDGCSG